MYRSPGDDLPSIVSFCGYNISVEHIRQDKSVVIRDVLLFCNNLVLLHADRRPHLIDAYARLCKAMICGVDLAEINESLVPFREAIQWAGDWNSLKG